MDRERWQQIDGLLSSALQLEPDQRKAFLTTVCAGDEELRRELEALLHAHDHAGDLLEQPPVQKLDLEPSADQKTDALIGMQLGFYHVEELIGKGGMGRVYRARDTRLPRHVALKVLPEEYGEDVERVRRFKREAQTASALNHPNIVTLHDVGESEGKLYLATEYIEGQTLRQRLAEGRLAVKEVLDLGIQIAGALAVAHRAGIVHRDIKPENIMIRPDGLVKVLDFGLARVTEPEIGTAETTRTATTGSGIIMGTVGYMSPEQVQGGKLDERSDIFSFGAVLYEMLSGKRAFQRDSTSQTLAAIVDEEPKAIGELVPGVPLELDPILGRCLHKDREHRFQRMDHVKSELEEVSEKLKSGALEVTAPHGRIASVAVLAGVSVLAVAIGIGSWLWLFRPSTARPGKEASHPNINLSAVPRPLTSLPGIERYPNIAPGGNFVAFVWNGGGDGYFHIYVVPVTGGKPFPVTRAPADDAKPVWSPRGDRIAFLRREGPRTGLWEVPFPAGDEKRIKLLRRTVDDFGTGLDWSADGRYLALNDDVSGSGGQAIFLLDASTAEMTQVSNPPIEAVGDSNPVISPDGREIAFLREWAGGSYCVFSQRLTDGKPDGDARQHTSPEMTHGLAWSPDGTELLYSTRLGLWRISHSGGEPIPVASAPAARDLTVDHTGRRLIYAAFEGNADIWRMPGPAATKHAERQPFIRSTRNEGEPRYSPDGSQIAFVSDRSGTPNIWLANADGTNQRQLTKFDFAVTPQWSPRGDAVAFLRGMSDPSDIYVIRPEDAQPIAITRDGMPKGVPVWSPNGAWIYYNRRSEAPAADAAWWQIWKVPSGGGESRQVTDSGQCPLAVDERFVYFHKAPSEISLGQVWRIPHEGGEETLVSGEKMYSWEWCLWDGMLVYIDRSQPEGPAVRTVSIDGGHATTLAPLDFPRLLTMEYSEYMYGWLTVSPDGRWILYGKHTISDADLMVIESAP